MGITKNILKEKDPKEYYQNMRIEKMATIQNHTEKEEDGRDRPPLDAKNDRNLGKDHQKEKIGRNLNLKTPTPRKTKRGLISYQME